MNEVIEYYTFFLSSNDLFEGNLSKEQWVFIESISFLASSKSCFGFRSYTLVDRIYDICAACLSDIFSIYFSTLFALIAQIG